MCHHTKILVKRSTSRFGLFHGDRIGTVLQAYLYRCEEDVRVLLADGIRIRLCKGVYKEPPTLAFPNKKDVDANYVKLTKILLTSGVYHGQPRTMRRSSGQPRNLWKERASTSAALSFRCLWRSPRSAKLSGEARLRHAHLRSVRHGLVPLLDAPSGGTSRKRSIHRQESFQIIRQNSQCQGQIEATGMRA